MVKNEIYNINLVVLSFKIYDNSYTSHQYHLLNKLIVKFNLVSYFTEVQAVNEYEKYLWTLIHDLGVQLKTSAHCTGLQCIRQGKFTLDKALLRKHWQLDHIIDNMDSCRELMEENEQLLHPKSAHLSV